MFSGLIKLREIARLAKAGRHEAVLDLARDPVIRDHRQAVVLAERARAALQAEATRLEQRDLPEAIRLLHAVLRDREIPGVRRELERLLAERREQDLVVRRQEAQLAEAEAFRRRGLVGEAQARIHALEVPSARREALLAACAEALKAGEAQGRAAAERLKRGDLPGALEELLRRADAALDEPHAVRAWAELAERADGDAALTERIFRHWSAMGGAESTGLAPVRDALACLADSAVLAFRKAVGRGEGALAARWRSAAELHPRSAEAVRAPAAAIDQLSRASALLARGEESRAAELIAAAEAELGAHGLVAAVREQRAALQSVARAFNAVDSDLRAGGLRAARGKLLELAPDWPEHFELHARLKDLAQREANDLDALSSIREALRLGGTDRLVTARRLLVALKTRRSDLEDLSLLEREIALAERRLGDSAGAPSMPVAGPRPIRFREVPIPAADPATELVPERFVLRVEEGGDWLVVTGRSLLIGAQGGLAADLPVQAAISTRHLRIEREGSRYRVVPEPGAKTALNARPIEGAHVLEHGDRLRLGRNLELRFRQPIEGNHTAVLHFEGDFSAYGCRRVILFCEEGRDHAIVIGAAPRAHIEVRAGAERAEIFRKDRASPLFARCPQGVALGTDEPRPQVRLRAECSVRAAGQTFYLEPLA